jgi:uncharacterized protein YcfJ
MKKKILMGAAIGAAAVLSAGATAGYLAWKNPAYAEVVGVEPVTQVVTTQDKTCRSLQAAQRKSAREDEPIIGTVIDGMAGGVVRRQDANGVASVVSTRAELLGRETAGDQAQKKIQEKDTYSADGKHCRGRNRVSAKVVAYDVRYRLYGKTSKVRMDHDPGQRLPVKDGKVVINRS